MGHTGFTRDMTFTGMFIGLATGLFTVLFIAPSTALLSAMIPVHCLMVLFTGLLVACTIYHLLRVHVG